MLNKKPPTHETDKPAYTTFIAYGFFFVLSLLIYLYHKGRYFFSAEEGVKHIAKEARIEKGSQQRIAIAQVLQIQLINQPKKDKDLQPKIDKNLHSLKVNTKTKQKANAKVNTKTKRKTNAKVNAKTNPKTNVEKKISTPINTASQNPLKVYNHEQTQSIVKAMQKLHKSARFLLNFSYDVNSTTANDFIKTLAFLYYLHEYIIASIYLCRNNNPSHYDLLIKYRIQLLHGLIPKIALEKTCILETLAQLKEFLPRDLFVLCRSEGRSQIPIVPDDYYKKLAKKANSSLHPSSHTSMCDLKLFELSVSRTRDERLLDINSIKNDDFAVWIKTCITPFIHHLGENFYFRQDDQLKINPIYEAALKMMIILVGEYCGFERYSYFTTMPILTLYSQLRNNLAHNIEVTLPELQSFLALNKKMARNSMVFSNNASQEILCALLQPTRTLSLQTDNVVTTFPNNHFIFATPPDKSKHTIQKSPPSSISLQMRDIVRA